MASLWTADISHMRLKVDAVPMLGAHLVVVSLYGDDDRYQALTRQTLTVNEDDLKVADALHLIGVIHMLAGERTP